MKLTLQQYNNTFSLLCRSKVFNFLWSKSNIVGLLLLNHRQRICSPVGVTSLLGAITAVNYECIPSFLVMPIHPVQNLWLEILFLASHTIKFYNHYYCVFQQLSVSGVCSLSIVLNCFSSTDLQRTLQCLQLLFIFKIKAMGRSNTCAGNSKVLLSYGFLALKPYIARGFQVAYKGTTRLKEQHTFI